jgi:hypothetical protein
MKLKFIKTVTGCYNEIYRKDDIIEYSPWNHYWQDMSEQERVSKGIYIHCHGQGEFDVFNSTEVTPVVI